MVTVRIIGKLLIGAILLAAGSVIVFVSQLYSPLLLWIISFSLLIGSLVVGAYVGERSRRLLFTGISSIVICTNFLLNALFGNPAIIAALYGVGLALLIWALLFSLSEIAASMRPLKSAHGSGEA
jgi:hypothetical protein